MKAGDVVICTWCGGGSPCLARVLNVGIKSTRVQIMVDLNSYQHGAVNLTGLKCDDPTPEYLRVLKPAEYLQYLL